MTVYESFGVTPIINGLGTFTRTGGTLMPKEVLDSQRRAAEHFVCMEELQYEAGREIARLTGAEAAYVTSGAQAALVLSVAACITGHDAAKMDRLPHTDGMPNQVIMARLHRNHYDHAVETGGGRIVEVGTEAGCRLDDLEEAIGPETVAILFLPWEDERLDLHAVLAVARRHDISVIIDAAGRCDEPENLTRFAKAGADLVCYSGGKYIRGPQSSGFVCGRRDLISAIAWQHLDMDFTPSVWTAPAELLAADQVEFIPRQGIGRGYKAGKEEIVGLLTALRLYFARDHAAEKAECRRKLDRIREQLADVPGVTTEIIPPHPVQRGFPQVRIKVDRTVLGLTGYDFIRELKGGRPSIHPGERELERDAVVIHPFGLKDGDEQAIVHRVRTIAAARTS